MNNCIKRIRRFKCSLRGEAIHNLVNFTNTTNTPKYNAYQLKRLTRIIPLPVVKHLKQTLSKIKNIEKISETLISKYLIGISNQELGIYISIKATGIVIYKLDVFEISYLTVFKKNALPLNINIDKEKLKENNDVLQLINAFAINCLIANPLNSLMEDYLKQIEEIDFDGIISEIKAKYQSRHSLKDIKSKNFLINKEVSTETRITRRSGRDDIHHDTRKITYTVRFEKSNEHIASIETKLNKSLEVINEFESSSTHYYGGSESNNNETFFDTTLSKCFKNIIEKNNVKLNVEKYKRIEKYVLIAKAQADKEFEDYKAKLWIHTLYSERDDYIAKYLSSIVIINMLYNKEFNKIYFKQIRYKAMLIDYLLDIKYFDMHWMFKEIYFANKEILNSFIEQKMETAEFKCYFNYLYVELHEEETVYDIRTIIKFFAWEYA